MTKCAPLSELPAALTTNTSGKSEKRGKPMQPPRLPRYLQNPKGRTSIHPPAPERFSFAAMLPTLQAGQVWAHLRKATRYAPGGRCRSSRSEAPARAGRAHSGHRPAAARRVLPILPARPTLEAPQDVRSASRAHRAQLPEPSITGTRPRITGHAAADPRQGTRSFPQ